MLKPKVSVLICTYNSGNYIINTLKSCLNQTYSNFEILILDNKSTDGTIDNIESFKDERIKLFKSDKNLGPYGGLNFLLDTSVGNYIAIQDHDDLWAKTKLEDQVNFLEENKEFIGCGTESVMYYESDKYYFLYYWGETNFRTIHSSLLFRNGDYRYDESILYFADGYFQKYILCQGKKLIYNIKKPLTLHLIKDGLNNLSYSWFKFNFSNVKRIFELHGYSFYAILTLGYELIRHIFIKTGLAKSFPKLFKIFDRLPYRIVGSKFESIDDNTVLKESFFN